jgi:hypothetical protein
VSPKKLDGRVVSLEVFTETSRYLRSCAAFETKGDVDGGQRMPRFKHQGAPREGGEMLVGQRLYHTSPA